MVKPATHHLAQWLISRETSSLSSALSVADTQALFRVVEKLRNLLVVLVGKAGFKSLLSRAHVLAQRECASLSSYFVTDEGLLELTPGEKYSSSQEAVLSGGTLLLSHFVDLLITFIGETLSLSLLRDIWPDAPFEDQNSEKRNHP